MFEELTQRMQYDVVHTMFHVVLTEQPADGAARRPSPVKKADPVSPMEAVNPKNRDKVAVGAASKVGRNAQCPCGSGKKHKRCHGATT